jgi:hypothetical protein
MISGMSTIYSRKVTVRAIGVTVAAAALTVGCAAKTSNAAAPLSTPATTSAAVSGADAPAAEASASASSAEQALARWTGAVISGDFEQACSLMADGDKTPPKVFSPDTCAGKNDTVKGLHKVLDGLHTAFTPDNAATSPHVEITGPAAVGDAAKITADKVSVDGKTLDDIVLSHSTGVQPGQTKMTFSLQKVEEAWYVTDFDLKL